MKCDWLPFRTISSDFFFLLSFYVNLERLKVLYTLKITRKNLSPFLQISSIHLHEGKNLDKHSKFCYSFPLPTYHWNSGNICVEKNSVYFSNARWLFVAPKLENKNICRSISWELDYLHSFLPCVCSVL